MVVEFSWLIPGLPLISFVIPLIFGNRLRHGGGYIALGSIGASLALAALVFLEVSLGTNFSTGQPLKLPFEVSATWFSFENTILEGGILVDQLTAIMVLTITLVSTLIIIFSLGYMSREKGLPRYYAIMSLFISSMLGIVTANNFLQLYVFWELVGLCSYLLIGFWYTKPAAAAAAKKAFLVTRLGDVMLLGGILIIFNIYHTFNFLAIQEQLQLFDPSVMLGVLTLTTALIFGGAQGKSAQFPLHVWLPDAMEGPSTVSALIHAATMVVAGVFLVARSFALFVLTPDTLLYVAIIGAFTAFIAATLGLSVNDMKRIIAYSTISTIGFMMLALGSGILGFTAGIFLLMNHAFFKALVFLAAGSVLHATGLLDIHKMGGLHKKMKITSIAMFIGVFSAAGLPPFSGFFGKDEVLLATLNATATNPVYSVLFVMSLVTAFLTVVFLFRMWFLIFTGTPRSSFEAHESPKVMTVPLAILSALAIASGFSLFIGPGFGSFVFFEHAEVLQFSPLVTISSVSAGLAGLLVAYLLYYKQSYPSNRFYSGRFGNGLLRILMNKYWMDHIFYGFAEKVSYRFTLVIDWFDLYGIDGIVNGIGSGLATAGTKLRRIQTGFVSVYATIIAIGMIVLMIWLVLVGV